MDYLDSNDIEVKKQILHILLDFSVGDYEKILSQKDNKSIRELIIAAAVAWQKVVPPITINNVDIKNA